MDVEVEVVPPDNLGLDNLEHSLIVPKPQEETTMESGVIDEDAVPDEPPVAGPHPDEIRAQGYIWSTNPKDYLLYTHSQGNAYAFGDRIGYVIDPDGIADAWGHDYRKNVRYFVFKNRSSWFTPTPTSLEPTSLFRTAS